MSQELPRRVLDAKPVKGSDLDAALKLLQPGETPVSLSHLRASLNAFGLDVDAVALLIELITHDFKCLFHQGQHSVFLCATCWDGVFGFRCVPESLAPRLVVERDNLIVPKPPEPPKRKPA